MRELFKTGDVFVYGSNGACVITDIKQERFARETKTYYILTPYINRRETIFVPVDSEALTARMKKVLTQDEIIEMIKSIPSCDIIWLDNANARREEYKRIINAAERKELLRLIKTLREKKAALEADGKSLSVSDDRFYKKARTIINSEIAFVMELEMKEVEPFIEKVLEAA